jgi:hypothetical protein
MVLTAFIFVSTRAYTGGYARYLQHTIPELCLYPRATLPETSSSLQGVCVFAEDVSAALLEVLRRECALRRCPLPLPTLFPVLVVERIVSGEPPTSRMGSGLAYGSPCKFFHLVTVRYVLGGGSQRLHRLLGTARRSLEDAFATLVEVLRYEQA